MDIQIVVSWIWLIFYSFVNFCEADGPGPRVVGGRDALDGEAPYQVSIRLLARDFPFGKGHICGGTLISNTTVVTAAHCVYTERGLYKPSDFRLVMGTLNRFDPNGAFIITIDRVVYHKNFNLVTLKNDIALMHIKEVSATNPEINFPTPVDLVESEFSPGSKCKVSGWGDTIFGSSSGSVKLQVAEIPILNTTFCKDNFFYEGRIHDGMICAGVLQGNIDSCQGDSGGPLVCANDDDDTLRLVGIVSWGDGCGHVFRPGVYTDVLHYKDWIKKSEAWKLTPSFIVSFLTWAHLVMKIIDFTTN